MKLVYFNINDNHMLKRVHMQNNLGFRNQVKKMDLGDVDQNHIKHSKVFFNSAGSAVGRATPFCLW